MEDDKNGYIIPIRSLEILKKKISFLYNNPKRCFEMGMIAKEKVNSKYSWESYGKRQIDLYLSILKNKYK